MSVSVLLDRLDKVRETSPHSWIARCPAHDDGRPSLSIRETDDRRILIHCFAGCGASDIVIALGLELADLFDKPIGHLVRGSRPRFPVRDLLEILSEETSVVALVAANLIENESLTEEDWKRLAVAAARIGRARDHI